MTKEEIDGHREALVRIIDACEGDDIEAVLEGLDSILLMLVFSMGGIAMSILKIRHIKEAN